MNGVPLIVVHFKLIDIYRDIIAHRSQLSTTYFLSDVDLWEQCLYVLIIVYVSSKKNIFI